MFLKMMVCMFVFVRKDVDVRVKNERVGVLDRGSGGFGIDYVWRVMVK